MASGQVIYRLCWGALLLVGAAATSANHWRDDPLALPAPGDYSLRIVSPTVLELIWINTKPPDPAPVPDWRFAKHPPAPGELRVQAGQRELSVDRVGFKRRVLYAPLKVRDLRIGNYLYLVLGQPVAAGQTIRVTNPNGQAWPPSVIFTATMNPHRQSPVLHVNQVGYLPGEAKTALVGYYLGSLGEMALGRPLSFQIVEVSSGQAVFRGELSPRPEVGFTFPCYRQVWEADFTAFHQPGQYRLSVPGLGDSFPFWIEDSVAACFARDYALGLYHQRCGAANALPFTRFVHAPCHTAPATIPLPQTDYRFTWNTISNYAATINPNNPPQLAPPLTHAAAQLYPYVERGSVDVSGGHHDAGDYSKYTINSAALVHYLMFAVDALPGVAELDNLGLPESGDGLSDVMEEAKWEADFLAKLQDADGGFFFLVYPRNREYESNVLPDHGDPQVVWPKNTAATAAAVAALAQCASSPHFRRAFPQAAAAYRAKAQKGWAFLEHALARYGKDGAYQKLTHYGDNFRHDDELAWAACEMFLATGEEKYQQRLLEWLHPSDPATRRWGWWRLCESYGCAIRDYAFAARTGRLKPTQLDLQLLTQCETELMAGAEDQCRRAQSSAYGTSFPLETKRVRSAGWYFSLDQAFDLAVACQLAYPPLNDPRPQYRAAILSNLNYEAGGNPVNICYLTGLGWRRPREIVDQYAQNDHRVLPPPGLPVGNIQAGFGWLDLYKQELGALTFPADGDPAAPYPFYDRWGDSFNLQTEFVIVNQGRSLACAAWLMAQTPLKSQPWKSAPGQITGLVSPLHGGQTLRLTVSVPGVAQPPDTIIWEATNHSPTLGPIFTFHPVEPGPAWVEAELQWRDGRRAFAVANVTVAGQLGPKGER